VTAPPSSKSQLQYVVIPHPDDEFEGWSMVEAAASNYPVFILLTHGEGTTFADGHGYDPARGERAPQPQPFHGPGSLFVHAQRVDSWHQFLDAMAGIDPTLDSPPFDSHLSVDGRAFDVFVGDRTARVVFDLGDRQLVPLTVAWALQTVRSHVRPLLPTQVEYGVIGAAYYNASYDGAKYTHPDHQAVHRALWDHDFGLPGPQWGRTAAADPDVRRTSAISVDTYRAVMDPGTNPASLGLHHRLYGWLSDVPADYDVEGDGIFSRVQSFWQRF
jgi:hypothetical protein